MWRWWQGGGRWCWRHGRYCNHPPRHYQAGHHVGGIVGLLIGVVIVLAVLTGGEDE